VNHEQLFTDTSLACAQLITRRYSTSFSLGIRTLDKSLHRAIYAIYGFVRWADEIVDTFHSQNKAALLADFERDTYVAIASGFSLNPVLHAFQWVVNEYQIDHEFIDAFLRSMEMDLEDHNYRQELYDKYIYGSAEVVGLMCLRVFCHQQPALFDRLQEPARRLGAAFQKVNFLRDIRSDYEDRGRVYFPGLRYEHFDNDHKREIEADIRADFKAAYVGIQQLPRAAKLGVHLAYVYYLKLFYKLRKAPAAQVLAERVRLPDNKKLLLLLSSWLRYRLTN
jgi:phytoene synthase